MTHDMTRGKFRRNASAAAAALVFTLLLPGVSHASARAATRAQGQAAITQTQPAASQSAEDDFARGRRLLAEGDAASAAVALKAAAEARKTDADVWYYYGLALTRARRAKDARKAFERAVQLRPDSSDAHAGLAFALLMLGKERDAEASARRALADAPAHGESHYVLGVVRFREEKFDAALEEAEAALRGKPDFPAAAYLAGDALLNLYLGESEQQAELYKAGVGPYEQRLALEKREPALAPLRTRMLGLADRLDAFAAAQPNSPEAPIWREQAETLRMYGRPPSAGGAPAVVLRQNEVTTRAVIHSKPPANFTEEARQSKVSGTVRLRAVLGADGRVRNIVAVRRLPDGLTEASIAAARQIRFTPATLNGHPVSQFVLLEYNFNVR
jgi:tetratricopeptide (TPR) repeat protein